VLANVLSMNS